MSPVRRVVGRRALLACIALLAAACAPLFVTGAAVTAAGIMDRRTAGAQVEDQALQIRGNHAIKAVLPGTEQAYAYVTSYNRRILLTGLAPDARSKARAEQALAGLENVRQIHNELRVGPVPADASAARDTVTSTRVRAALLQEKDVEPLAVKVVTEARVVYLMGLVTEREGNRVSDVVRRIPGVEKVITLYDHITEEQLGELVRERERNAVVSDPGPIN